MIVLLLLGSSVCVGLSHGVSEDYGTSHRMYLDPNVHSIEFKPVYKSEVTVLWKRDEPPASFDSRKHVIGSYYVINNLTQRDSGRYILKDKNQRTLSTKTIDVKEITRLYTLYPDEELSFTFDLQLNSCNIYFFPKNDHEQSYFISRLVRRGRLQEGLYRFDCTGFDLQKPCGIFNKAVQMSCEGRFEIRDQNDDMALEVELVIKTHKDPLYTAIGVTGFIVALIGCCCVKCCCCGKSSSEKNDSETAAQPAVNFHEYNRPAGPGQDQSSPPTMTPYPVVPPYIPTDPLVHNHSTGNMPSSYSEVSAPAEKPDAATAPLCSDIEPRFELKGVTFPSFFPLSSDSGYCDVYTSDKLNFK
ncbi:uncharacterized protein LOC113160070 [Anabas testudineus]|uniref:uncharacterized protein LOC113160070 n=1 Tax=Anabas testudineus TaxID=64144 RepID=UPI000E4588BD|nr:uncharacterized protein LOC113160070 [Anabas testudineus]